MGALLNLTVLALALDAGLLAGVLIWRLVWAPESLSILNLGPLLVAAGVLTALVAFLFNLRRARSEDLLEAATDLLEKAYEMLAPKDESSQPTNRRLAWLSSARLVITAETLGKNITEPSHELIYQEKKEYWRTRLYELICPSIEGLPSSFYAESPEHMIAYSGEFATRCQRSPWPFFIALFVGLKVSPIRLEMSPTSRTRRSIECVPSAHAGLGALLLKLVVCVNRSLRNDAQSVG